MAKHNDAKGYERGARGIDGRDGEDWHGGRFPDGGAAVAVGKVSGDNGGPGDKKSIAGLQKSAKGK